jgi:hypothetical protein
MEMRMRNIYQEEIDGDAVTFEVIDSGKALTFPVLVAKLVRDGKEVWESVLPWIATGGVPIVEQVALPRLREMYRLARLSEPSRK